MNGYQPTLLFLLILRYEQVPAQSHGDNPTVNVHKLINVTNVDIRQILISPPVLRVRYQFCCRTL